MYSIGDMIAHPLHGAGIIDSIESREINGCERQYYVLKMPAGGMVVMIPTEMSELIGVRPIIGSDEAESLMDAIPDIDIEMTSNWSRRYRENMERLKSGNLLEVARVVKSLMARDVARGLSTGDRKMLVSAKQILISEMVLSQHKSYEEVEIRINKAMA
ncbi:MAG: CarD family transcriptional regulator [Oscillospiraceae bacterium]|jgi:CarD family transcriptional regulator|nr:CarD family transcriptional regulator [Oscillospiraceae bacterium]